VYSSFGQRFKFYEGLIRELIAFANYEFYWGGRQSDGATVQDHVDVAKKNCLASLVITDQTFSDTPDKVESPYELEHVWSWFKELDSTRLIGMTLGPITHCEITAWADGEGIRLMPFQRRAIRALDVAYINFQNKQGK
jgi:hypothetical protein